MPRIGEATSGKSTLVTMPFDVQAARLAAEPDGGQRAADHAADERMRAGAWDADPPRQQVPDDGADKGRRHDHLPLVPRRRVHDAGGHEGRHRRPGQGTEEVGRRGHEDGLVRPKGLSRDRGGDRVGRVVEAVDVVEPDRQADDDDEDERDALRHA